MDDFDSLCNSRWFRNTSFVLYFKGFEKLRKQFKRVPLDHFLPDYIGNVNDYNSEFAHFENLFLRLKTSRSMNDIYASSPPPSTIP